MALEKVHISRQREEEALRKFRHKVTVLEGMIARPVHPQAPPTTDKRPFIRWTCPELGVESISPALFYRDEPEHTLLRKRAEDALSALARLRRRPQKTETELATAKVRLKQAQRREKLVDAELVSARAQMERMTHDIKVLRQRLKRKNAQPRKVVKFPTNPGQAA